MKFLKQIIMGGKNPPKTTYILIKKVVSVKKLNILNLIYRYCICTCKELLPTKA